MLTDIAIDMYGREKYLQGIKNGGFMTKRVYVAALTQNLRIAEEDASLSYERVDKQLIAEGIVEHVGIPKSKADQQFSEVMKNGLER